MKFEDNLIIGFDYTEQEDITCLAVARLSGEKVEVLRIFHGQEAEELYEKLTNFKLPALEPKERKSCFTE